MQVVTTANNDRIEPKAFSCKSVTVAIPTPTRRIRRDPCMLLLQIVTKVLAVTVNQSDDISLSI